MTEDEARMARIDAMIAELEATIDEARNTSARMTDFLREMGVESETALRDMMRSEQCSPALRAMMEEDMAKLDRELMEAERNLWAESGHREGAETTPQVPLPQFWNCTGLIAGSGGSESSPIVPD